MNTPVQEQAVESKDSYYCIPELIWGIQAKYSDSSSSSAELSSDDSSSIISDSTNDPTADIIQAPPEVGVIVVDFTDDDDKDKPPYLTFLELISTRQQTIPGPKSSS